MNRRWFASDCESNGVLLGTAGHEISTNICRTLLAIHLVVAVSGWHAGQIGLIAVD